MTRRFVLPALVLAMCWNLGSVAAAETNSHFRGDGGVAANDGERLPERFDDNELVWRQELPSGHSTPCITDTLIFLTTHKDGELATVALDRATGAVRWKRVAPADRLEKVHQVGSLAASTTACNGKQVFSFFGSYGMLCYDLDGKLLWSKPMGPFQDEFGTSSSPVLVDGKVIMSHDHDVDSFLIAIDQKTGKTVWKVSREGFTRGYSTPVIWEHDGRKQILVAGALQLIAYDASDGHKSWWVNGLARIVTTTPTTDSDMVYVAAWTPGGDTSGRIAMQPWEVAVKQWDKNTNGKIAKAELPDTEVAVLTRFYRIDMNQDGGLDQAEWSHHVRIFDLAENTAIGIRPRGEGDLTDTCVVWKERRSIPYVPSPLVYRGVVYLVKNAGIVTSLDAETGRVLKPGRSGGGGSYYASPIAGDGKVYLASEPGVITVLKAGPKWEILASHDFGQRIVATPVIADGKIYVRTEEAIYCFGVR